MTTIADTSNQIKTSMKLIPVHFTVLQELYCIRDMQYRNWSAWRPLKRNKDFTLYVF